jgi:aspartate racemase
MSRLGIITGSGPEAGVDLWNKILHHNRKLVGEAFRGDLDAPEVAIVSDPLLGLSMELEQNRHLVWPVLAKAATRLSPLVDYYAIACNTLNVFQPQLERLGLQARFVSFVDVLVAQLKREGVTKVALLGAQPVTELGPWSTYRRLADELELEPLSAELVQDLHALIYAVKLQGGSGHDLRERFEGILARLRSPTVLLACTELPLLCGVNAQGKTLIDPTDLMAQELVRLSRSMA